MVSNLTTGNSGLLPNSVRRKNGGFGFGPCVNLQTEGIPKMFPSATCKEHNPKMPTRVLYTWNFNLVRDFSWQNLENEHQCNLIIELSRCQSLRCVTLLRTCPCRKDISNEVWVPSNNNRNKMLLIRIQRGEKHNFQMTETYWKVQRLTTGKNEKAYS